MKTAPQFGSARGKIEMADDFDAEQFLETDPPAREELKQGPEHTPDLLPCPFCGCKAAWAEDGEQKQKYGNDQAYCPSCYASTTPDLGYEAAAAYWNQRYDTQPDSFREPAEIRRQMDGALLLCVSDGNGGGVVEIRFSDLRKAQDLHCALASSAPAQPGREWQPLIEIKGRHDERARERNFTACGCDYCEALSAALPAPPVEGRE